MCSPDNPHQTIAVAIADTAKAGPPPSPQLIEDLVTANHILFDQGVVDGFGRRQRHRKG